MYLAWFVFRWKSLLLYLNMKYKEWDFLNIWSQRQVTIQIKKKEVNEWRNVSVTEDVELGHPPQKNIGLTPHH